MLDSLGEFNAKTGGFLKELQDTIAEQKLDIERLTIENNLLRKASEQQREINGRLRQELKDLDRHCDAISSYLKQAEEDLEKQIWES